MCGICGFNWEDKETIKSMTDILSHRGPDQYNYYVDSFVSLGHRRLSIIDLSENGKQPMSNEQGNIWITYNGEIYNFKEIKNDLEKKGHIFKSNSDTEVIIHSYEEYGLDCVEIFNGMFSFAIWDSKNKKIILARDRLGIKPLFYFFNENKFIFASEIKSIIQNPEIKKEMNFSGLNQLIHYAYIINGETMIKNIFELKPGHILVYDFNEIKIKKFWDLKSDVQYKSEAFFSHKLRSLLKEAVRKRLVADVPLGASLSGGIDSSSIVALMSEIIKDPIKTFTVGFNDESDELKEARLVAEYCETEHHELIVDFKEITKELPKVLWHVEAPFAKPAMFATYFLSKGISKNNVIIDLAGEGSDETFAGYNRYDVYLHNQENQLTNEEKAKKIVSSYFSEADEKKDFFNETILNQMKTHLTPEKSFLPNLEKTHKREHLNAALEFELKKQLNGIHLWRIDRMSMSHSHEVRVPFLDHELIEFGMTIPSYLKWNENNKKYILQKAMKGLLPNQIVNRVKIPFHMPLLKYFQKDFIEIGENVLKESLILKKGFVKKDKILNQIKNIKTKQETNDNALRQILFLTNLELFNKLFLEKEKVTNNDLNINNFI